MNMHKRTMFFMLQIVFLVYNQVCQGQRKIHFPTEYKNFPKVQFSTGYKNFPGTYIVKCMCLFKKFYWVHKKFQTQWFLLWHCCFGKAGQIWHFVLLFVLSHTCNRCWCWNRGIKNLSFQYSRSFIPLTCTFPPPLHLFKKWLFDIACYEAMNI